MITILTQIDKNVSADDLQKSSFAELEVQIPEDKKADLDTYMKRVKAEYLQKILDQVNMQNAEYYENLASEYTIRLEKMEEKSK